MKYTALLLCVLAATAVAQTSEEAEGTEAEYEYEYYGFWDEYEYSAGEYEDEYEYEYEYNMWIPCSYGKGLFEPDCPCKPGTPGCEIPDIPCEEHYVRDCNDKCSPAFWIGNGQCDNVAEKAAKKTIKK